MFDLFVQDSHWSLNHLMIVHQPYQIQSYISGKWFSSFPLLWSVLLTTAMLDSIQAIFWFSFTVNFQTESGTIFISLQVHEYIFDPSLSSSFHLSCMDASIAIKPVFDRFQSVVITSGVWYHSIFLWLTSYLPVVRHWFKTWEMRQVQFLNEISIVKYRYHSLVCKTQFVIIVVFFISGIQTGLSDHTMIKEVCNLILWTNQCFSSWIVFIFSWHPRLCHQ